jgi:hypothetical protein
MVQKMPKMTECRIALANLLQIYLNAVTTKYMRAVDWNALTDQFAGLILLPMPGGS